MSIAYSASKKADFHYFSADTICSCIEAVDELFQGTMVYDCMEHDVNTIAVCVCITIVYSTLKKKRFSLFQLQIPYAAALKLLTSCFSTPWVMTAWNMMSILLLHVYICVLLILLKNTDFHYCSCRYHLQLH